MLAYGFDGKLAGRALARQAMVSPDGKRLVAGVADGRLQVFDALTLRPLAPLDFESGVSGVSFENASGRLVVVTQDQRVFTFDPAALAAAPQSR